MLYEPGGMFKPHTDTEKEDVILPSFLTGGEIIVQHKENEIKYDFGGENSQFETNMKFFQ